MTPFLLFLLALLIPSVSITLQAEAPIVDIMLIDKSDKENYEEIPPPDHLIIAVFTNTDCYFKLSSGTGVTAAGQFTKGMNTIIIPAAPLLEKNGVNKYNYVLEVKTGDTTFQKAITLEIIVKYGSPVNLIENEVKTDTGKTRYYEISMSVGDHYIDSFLKPVNPFQVLAGYGKKTPPPLEFDPVFMSKPLQYKAAVSPLTLAYMAYKSIDKKVKKNKALKLKELLEKTRQITGTFWKKDAKGAKIPLFINIKINTN